MASVTSTGIGSGIDVKGLVASLVASEGAAKSARLDRREASYTAKLSSLSTLKGSVSEFQSSYSALKSVASFNALTSSSSDRDVFTVSANKGAASGSYDITVTSLAAAQRLQTSAGQLDINSTVIDTGTLTFAFKSDIDLANGVTYDVDITGGTLEDIRDSINAADIGVKANIVFDGTDYELVMTSKTGVDNELTITQTSTSNGLSVFEYNSATSSGNLTQTLASANAIFTVDGVGITSASNTNTTVLSDVTLELKGLGTSETLTIAENNSAVGAAVQGFVDGYNTLMTELNSATAYNAEASNGILIGDSTVRGIVSQLRSILNTTIGDSTTQYNSLSSVGILTKRDGTLEYDSAKLSAALSAKPNEVQFLLAGGRTSVSNPDISVTSIPDDLAAGSYAFEVGLAEGQATIGSSNVVSIAASSYDLSNPALDLSFGLTVDGISSGALSIPYANYYSNAGSSTAQAGLDIASAIQSAINGDAVISGAGKSVTVSYSETSGNAVYSIVSDSFGASSSLELSLSGDLTTFLGLTSNVGSAVYGNDSDGATEIGSVTANASDSTYTGTEKFDGFELDYSGGSIGVIGSITVKDGLMDNLDTLVESFLASDGYIDAKTDGLNSSIADITEARAKLNDRLEGYEARLLKQFNAMDLMVAKLNSTSTFLTNQLGSLNSLANRGNK